MSARPRLSDLPLVDPHVAEGWAHLLIAAFPEGPGSPARPAADGLDVEVAGAGRTWRLDEWNAATHGTSLLVISGGRVVHEWYADGLGPDTLFLGASMTKSALAHLVGIALREGALGLDDEVAGHVPELAASGYARCTVLDLLTMTSGVEWVEDYRDPASPATRLLAAFADGGDSRAQLVAVGAADPPGTRYAYNTADSQVLDWVRERATGAAYDVALGNLWRRLGCTSDAVVGTDGVGVALAGGALAATARDWARLVTLQLDGTADDGIRVLDEAWVRDSSAADRPFLRPGRLPSTITTHAGFGRHWWPLDDNGTRVTADGSRGQFGFLDRDLGVVVVKTSRWPYDDWLVDRQLRDLCYLGLPEIARAAAASSSGAAGGQDGAMSSRVATPYEGSPDLTWDGSTPIEAPLRPHRTRVTRALTDYNGHLTESAYLLVLGDSADAFFRFLGVDEAYRAAGHSLFTAQTHLHHRAEAVEGDVLDCSLRVLDADDRRLHVYHEIHDGNARLLAAAEQLLVHVDTSAGGSSPMPRDVADRVAAVREAHAALPASPWVGRSLGIRRRAGREEG